MAVSPREGENELVSAGREALARRDIPAAHRLAIEVRERHGTAAAAELEAEIMLTDGSLRPAAELLEQAAVEAAGDSSRAARMLATATNAWNAAGRLDLAEKTADRAQLHARSADPATRVRVHLVAGDVQTALGRWSEGQRHYRAAISIGEEAGVAHLPSQPRVWLAEAHYSCTEYDRARDLTLVAIREARAVGAVAELTDALQLLFSIELSSGRIRAAAAVASEELEQTTGEGRLMERKEALGHLAWCAAHEAQSERCRELVRERYELTERLGDDSLLHPSLGVLELGLGDAEAASRAFRRTLRTYELRSHLLTGGAFIFGGEVIEAESFAGREDEARRLLSQLEEEAGRSGRPHALSLVHRCRGLLAQDGFDSEFELALEHDAADPHPLERARTLLSWGMRLRRAKRRRDAREKLKAGHDELERLGSRLWAQRAQTELAATGERARRRDPATASELTDRERHVAGLVADGLSNREIAERLYVTTNTVETHLRHIFQKRGVRSRAELVRSFFDVQGSVQ